MQCALEACRILDRHGVLRQANQESRRARKVENSDDSDDDNFFDRTGDVEKKRLKKLGQSSTEALTYEQLLEQETEILDKITTQEHKLELMVELEKRQKRQNDEDLDQFMNNLSHMDQKVDKFAISSTKLEIQKMKTEHQRIQKLINIAKPSISLPPVTTTKNKLPLFGKRNAIGRIFGSKKSVESVEVKKVEETKPFETEEDENDEGDTKKINTNTTKGVPESLPSEEVKKVIEIVKKSPEKESKEETFKEKEVEKIEPEEKKLKLEETSSAVEQSKASTSEPTTKKRKSRIRIRNKLRENIDMNDDDEYIDEEKISTWVAPDDQTGDGTTHLNAKFGY